MGNAVLMIAYHVPPAAMGSGHLRTMAFARHLPALGWEPIVLSARALAYPRTAPLDGESIPPGCVVHRALALDAQRHFGVAGKYPGILAQPDRWGSWWLAAVCQGLRLIRRHRVRAIWSTYPIMTAHCIAHTLSQIAGLPWIADFRDPVSGSVSMENPYAFASQQRWEKRVMSRAARVVFTTPGALGACAERFPEAHAQGRLAVIGNGYDERAFAGIPGPAPKREGKPLVMVHSGFLYPDGRDPLPFFRALAQLKAAGHVDASNLKVVLRASGSEATYARQLQQLGLTDMVDLAAPVSNRQALVEQAEADALLLFQGSRFDRQIPAKVYEYLRVGRPVFALVGEQGDTAALLHTTGGAALAPIDDTDLIARRLRAFIDALRDNRGPRADPDIVAGLSRREGATLLAGALDQVSA